MLDDFSRYILAWTLRTSMSATDVMETLDLARAAANVDRVPVVHRPRLLSDNGPCYISAEPASYLETSGLEHTRGAPYHPMTQGKIERYHRSLKNVVKLDHYYSPWELERAIARFVEDYNHRRYHESLQNVTRADVYFGRQAVILARRDRIKQRTLQRRKKENLHTPHLAVIRSQVSLRKSSERSFFDDVHWRNVIISRDDMTRTVSDHSLEFLLGFDGRIHHLEKGYWLKFEITRVAATTNRPHGLSCSFTLHAPNGTRLVGFDNAHDVPARGSRFKRRQQSTDHWHRTEKDPGRPYDFKDAETLIDDFFDEVERVLRDRGIGLRVTTTEASRRRK